MFSAASAAEFVAAGAEAVREFGPGQLHVRLANGDWIAPTYRSGSTATDPDGRRWLPNMPVRLSGPPAPWLWLWCQQAKRDGDAFSGALEAVKRLATSPGCDGPGRASTAPRG